MIGIQRVLEMACAFAFAATTVIAQAATVFTVNSVADVPAAAPLDNGVCETVTGNGVCTLRAAIMKANHLPGGGATIMLPANAFPYRISPLTGTFQNDEAWGDFDILASMTIIGAGAANTVIDGDGRDRVVQIIVPDDVTVTITGVTIRNGDATKNDELFTKPGGGIFALRGNLILRDSVVTANRAGTGGGIFVHGLLTLTRVTLSGNVTSMDFDEGHGGGAFAQGNTTIEQSAILDNHADGEGGGLYATATLVVRDSIFAGNVAVLEGGGIYKGAATATITGSTFNANEGLRGGGIHAFATGITVNNSTVTANFGDEVGGGLGAEAGAVMQLFHVTVAGNIVSGKGDGGGVWLGTGAGSVLAVSNSILAENYVLDEPNDCGGFALLSQDFNYIQNPRCTINGPVGNTITGGDVLLDSLRDNGGATPTRALLAGSAGLDRIPPALCRDYAGAAPVPDQKGTIRPIGPLCDIGAFEGGRLPTLFGRNLVRNGGADDSAAFANAAGRAAVPHWTKVGALTLVRYGTPGGFPTLADAAAADRGRVFFAGGNGQTSGATQLISVAAIRDVVDAGLVTYVISGDFGGFGNQDDTATMSIRFLDANGAAFGAAQSIGHVTAAERANVTGFVHRSGNGAVPAGTRTILIDLTLQRAAAFGYNDGYADNLSLVLNTGAGTRATAIEYKHAAFDHYFVTVLDDEIAKLDHGVFPGWTRVGEAFTVFSDTPSSSSTVCRFFSTTFDPKSSHFYTPDPTECNIVKASADWQFEGNVFNVRVPAADGTCAQGWIPVYRLYNNGQGGAPNHRYTTSTVIRAQMLAAGWIPEGSGVGVAMCTPF